MGRFLNPRTEKGFYVSLACAAVVATPTQKSQIIRITNLQLTSGIPPDFTKTRLCVEQVFHGHNPKSILFGRTHMKWTKLNKNHLVTSI